MSNLDSLRNRVEKDIATLSKDFDREKNQWNLPSNQIAHRQEQIRELRFLLQAAQEKEIVATGTPTQVKMLKPLVLRREYLQEKSEDGKQFTFHPAQKVMVTVTVCPHYALSDLTAVNASNFSEVNAHLENCPEAYTREVEEELFAVKHSKGNLNCKGCLDAPPSDSPLLTKLISYCPKFIQMLSDQGPEKYEATIKKANPDTKICYAGLLHSEFKLDNNFGVWTRKCDTCGYETDERKELRPVEKEKLEFHVGVDVAFDSSASVLSCTCPECKVTLFSVTPEEEKNKKLTPEHDWIIDNHWETKHPDKIVMKG